MIDDLDPYERMSKNIESGKYGQTYCEGSPKEKFKSMDMICDWMEKQEEINKSLKDYIISTEERFNKMEKKLNGIVTGEQ